MQYRVEDFLATQQALASAEARITQLERETADLRKSVAGTERYRSIVDSQTELICRYDKDFRLTFVNRAYAARFGLEPEDMIGVCFLDYIPQEAREEAVALVRALSAENPVSINVIQSIVPGQPAHWHEWTDQMLFDAEGQFTEYQAVARDVTERKQQEILQVYLTEVLEAIAEDQPLPAVLEKLISVIESYQPGVRASVLLFDPVTGRLQHGAAPSLPDAYNAAADGLEIGAAVGSCGTAAYEKRAVIVEDIRTHPYWENYREIAEAHQLRACWSQPLLGRDGSVLGTLALYRSEPHIPSSHEQDVVRMTAHIAEIAIRRSRDIARQREAEAALQVANNALEQRVLERTAELETARKSIEEERNLLRTVIDAVPDFIYVKDLEYRIILSNAAHTRSLIAQNPDFAPGMTDSEIFPEPLLHHFLRDDEIVLREGKPVFKREELSIGEDGEVIWALTTKLPLRNLEGTITGLVGVTQDITDIKANEEALSQKYKEELRMQEFFRALSQRLELATQAGQIGIWDWDLRTGVIQWDARIYALYGLVIGEDEASTELWQRLVHPDDLEPAATALNAALIEGKPFELEFRVIRRDGSMRYVKSSGIVLWDTDGSAARMIGVNQDITDLRQALEKEKELSELKSRFVSMASHEFRTPLATILSTTDNLIRYRDRMTAEQVEERLNTTREQALHMREMMEDMLQLTRIQSGRVEIKPVMQDLDAFCRAIISGFELQADRTISIQYHTSAVPLMAEVDTKLFRQLVTNLIGNALKYSPDSKPIHVSLSSDTEWFTLSVRDEGIGIAEDDQKHLFVPFHRGINVGTISGTGLGLSIAKQVVEAHGGTIGVESQVGKGSIFTVRFPVRAQAAAAPIPDEAR